MLRGLGIMTAVKWFIIACVGLAIWQGFNGDIGAMGEALWGYVQDGAAVVTHIWDSVNSHAGQHKNK